MSPFHYLLFILFGLLKCVSTVHNGLWGGGGGGGEWSEKKNKKKNIHCKKTSFLKI
jgi:hypothetical protein